MAGLREHPTTPEWQPGNGGLCLHSIVPHPTDSDRLWVGDLRGRSLRDDRRRQDLGAAQQRRARRLRSLNPDPQFGQCVHKMGLHPTNPETLYQQNHCGVYRSEDGGRQWTEITGSLPSDFGFPLAIHPHDPSTLYVIPMTPPDKGRHMIDGHTRVWRSRDRGDSWQRAGQRPAQERRVPGRPARGHGNGPAGSGRRLLRDQHRVRSSPAPTRATAGSWSPTSCRRSGRSRRPSSTN